MQVSVIELTLFELLIVSRDSFDLVDYDMVTGKTIVSFMKLYV